jgi:hypothetical protein
MAVEVATETDQRKLTRAIRHKMPALDFAVELQEHQVRDGLAIWPRIVLNDPADLESDTVQSLLKQAIKPIWSGPYMVGPYLRPKRP